MSRPSLIVRRRVRAKVLTVAAEWSIARLRVPRDLIDLLEQDFERQITQRTLALLEHAPGGKKRAGQRSDPPAHDETNSH